MAADTGEASNTHQRALKRLDDRGREYTIRETMQAGVYEARYEDSAWDRCKPHLSPDARQRDAMIAAGDEYQRLRYMAMERFGMCAFAKEPIGNTADEHLLYEQWRRADRAMTPAERSNVIMVICDNQAPNKWERFRQGLIAIAITLGYLTRREKCA